MLEYTRRRALALLLAAVVGASLWPEGRAFAQDNAAEEQDTEEEDEDGEEECYETQKFGPWIGRATEALAGARHNDVPFKHPDQSPLRADVHVSANYDVRVVLYADPDKLQLSKEFLLDPENRVIVRDETGKERVDAALCGNCNDIEEDKFSVVLPLSTAPLLRDGPAIEIGFKLEGQDEHGFRLTLGQMRRALLWAGQRKAALADKSAEGKCAPIGALE